MVVEAQYIGSHWETRCSRLTSIHCLRVHLEALRRTCRIRSMGTLASGSAGSRTGLYSGVSNYEAASFILKKPFGYGVSADVSYTWSQLKDDMDSSGWGNQFGSVYYQDPLHPSANYAVSNFNRPNSFKGSIVYAIPLGKGHQ